MRFVLKDHIMVRKFIGKQSLKPPPTASKKETFYSSGSELPQRGGRGAHLHHLQKQVVAYSLCSAADGA